MCSTCFFGRFFREKAFSTITGSRSDGGRYTVSDSTGMPSSTCLTVAFVFRFTMDGRRLSRLGSVWVMTTNESPLWTGKFSKKVSKASIPPAEAPMPIMGKNPGFNRPVEAFFDFVFPGISFSLLQSPSIHALNGQGLLSNGRLDSPPLV